MGREAGVRGPEEPVAAGVVGCGWAGRIHARAIHADSRARLAAVCDTDPGRAGDLVRETGAADYRSCEEMLDHERLDCAVVATPPDSHAAIVTACLERGVSVLCEKPLTREPISAAGLVLLARRRGLLLAVGYNRRLSPCYGRLRSHIREAGRLHQMSAVLFQDGPTLKTDLVCDRFLVFDAASHMVDLLRFLRGEVVRVTARLQRIESEIWSDLCAVLEFGDGAMASLSTGFRGGLMASQHPIERVEAVTSRARVVADNAVDSVVTYPHAGECAQVWTPSIFVRRDYQWTMEALTGRWLAAVVGLAGRRFCEDEATAEADGEGGGGGSGGRATEEDLPTGEDGLAAVLACEAILRSAAEGRTVDVETPKAFLARFS